MTTTKVRMTTVINPLPIPKPKRFASRQKNPFLPLTLSSSSSGVVWKHFTGYLVGQWVVVFHRGDAEALSDANFGKGALSKFGMAFEDRDWKNVEFPGFYACCHMFAMAYVMRSSEFY